MTATPRRLLVVSYFHPPFPGAGGTRWQAMSRFLERAGHDVRIVASDAFGTLADPEEERRVLRAGDLKSAPWLRRVLGRGRLPAPGAGEVVVEAPAPALLTRVLVPDAHVVSWLPGAARAVRRLVARGEVDCLVTSGPPESAHLIALALGRRRPPWIADFRDGWSFEPLRDPFPTRVQRRADLALERRVARTAEVVLGATRPIAEDLERRLGANAHWVPNGWDPQAVPDAASPLPPRPGVATLVHTGTLSGSWGRDPESLLRALGRVTAEGVGLRLVLAGRLTEAEQALIGRLGLDDVVEHVGMLPRPQALALQRAADALVLLTSRNRGEATSKIYEYLAAERPVVALASANEAERIVRETGAGVTVDPDDVDGVATALRQVADGALPFAPHSLERFRFPGPAEQVEALVEEAVHLHSRRT